MTNFEYQQHRIRQWIMRQGEQIYYPTQAERKIIRKLLKDMPVLFPELLYRYGLRLLYLYNQQKGNPNDAICWKDVTNYAGTLYAIGIARWAIAYPTYFQLLFLHELAHVAVGGEHDKTFCDCLDRMIEKFNAATGASLVNDYGLGEKKRKQENR